MKDEFVCDCCGKITVVEKGLRQRCFFSDKNCVDCEEMDHCGILLMYNEAVLNEV